MPPSSDCSKKHNVCPRCGEKHTESHADCPSPRREYTRISIDEYSIDAVKDYPTLNLNFPSKREVLSLLTCPVNWNAVQPRGHLAVSLEWYWRQIATYHLDENMENVDIFSPDYVLDFDDPNQWSFSAYFQLWALADDDEAEVARRLPYIREKITRATKQYSLLTDRIRLMKLVTAGIYKKHYIASGTSDAEVIKRSEKGKKASLFFPIPTLIDHLEGYMWTLLEYYWKRILEVNKAVMYVDVGHVIGASCGKETQLLCMDFDFNTPQAHAYPVLPAEVEGDMLIGPWD